MGLWVTIFLGQTEIDDVNLVATLADAHEEVVWLDVTVDERLRVDVLNTGNELIGEQKNGLQRELAVAEVKEILQAGSKKIKDHGIVVTFSAEPANERDPDTASKRLVDTGLILELWVLSLYALKLDGNFFTRYDVGSEVNITETTTPDLTADAVFIAHAKILQKRVSML